MEAITIVVFVVVGVAAVAAVVLLATSGRSLDQVGRGGIAVEQQAPAVDDREADIRDLLEARNARRVARGEEPLDVDAELRSLARPVIAADPELVEEVRATVRAHNARLLAHGEQPLDVEAEVARKLRELGVG